MRRYLQALLETAIGPPTGMGAGAIATETPAAAGRGARLVGLGLALATVMVALLVPAAAKALSSGYVYEKVTPAYKGNGEVGGTGFQSGFRGSPSGDQIMYSGDTVFLGAPVFPQANVFYAQRGADSWLNSSVGAMIPLFPEFGLTVFPSKYPEPGIRYPQTLGFSEDGTKTVVGTNRDPQTGEPMAGRPFLLDMTTGGIERITPEPYDNGTGEIDPEEVVGLVGPPVGRADYSMLMLTSSENLTEEVATFKNGTRKLYRYEDGEFTLASWTPEGEPSTGEMPSATRNPAPTNDLSADGTVYWFSDSDTSSGNDLYRGEAGVQSSVWVSEPENEEEEIKDPRSKFAGADTDGERVVFISNGRFVKGASEFEDVYLFENSPEPEAENNLTLISEDNESADDGEGGAGVAEVFGVSDDAETIYFTTKGQQLVEGAPLTNGQKLYRWHDGTLSYLATAEGGIFGKDNLFDYMPRVTTPDGRYQTFVSKAPGITADDNGGLHQLYIYDAVSDEISCISCAPTGTSTAAVEMEPNNNIAAMDGPARRWLLDDGTAFFQSTERFVPEDTNGSSDVYVWKDGEVELISSGRSSVPPRFVDASADGSTIFFLSGERLTGWDTDEKVDLYVARLDGGLPLPNFRPEAECQGDACQGEPQTAPEAIGIGSRDVRVPARASARCNLNARRAVRVSRVARRTAVRILRVQRLARGADGRVKRRLEVRSRKLRKRTQQLRKRGVNLKRRADICRSRNR